MSRLKNDDYLVRLVGTIYAVDSLPALDRMYSERYGRPIVAWRLFRHLIRNASVDEWSWRSDLEQVGYPSKPCRSFHEFATVVFHEATHGCCHFLVGDVESDERGFIAKDEERFCWDVSRLLCQALGLTYDHALADMLYRYRLAVQAGDMDEIDILIARIPEHARPF